MEKATDYSLKKERSPFSLKPLFSQSSEAISTRKRKHDKEAFIGSGEVALNFSISDIIESESPSFKKQELENGVTLDLSQGSTNAPKPLSINNVMGVSKSPPDPKKIRQFKHMLREEEMKLLLLKKIFYSQLLKENLFQPLVSASQGATPDKKNSSHVTPSSNHHSSGAQIKTGMSLQNKPGLMPKSHILKDVPAYNKSNTPIPNKSTPISKPAPQTKAWPSNSSRSNEALVPGSLVDNGSSPNVSRQQQQEAAKMALRKQLEETLLQIPPPKPPLPDLHFIPNPNTPDFLVLLGLEWIVDLLVQPGSLHSRIAKVEPFRCAQCRTDFTPRWKWHKPCPGSNGMTVICEACATFNGKEAVRMEHTGRLKAAFMKVLQQEYEIEKSFSSSLAPTVTTAAPPPVTAPISQTSSSLKHLSHHQQQPPLQISPISSTKSSLGLTSLPANVRSSSHVLSANKSASHQTKSMTPAHLTSSKATTAQLPPTNISQALLQQNMQQLAAATASVRPQPAHMLQPYTPFLTAHQQQAYQRQMLLDMITPPSASASRLSTASNRNWKA